MHTVLALGGGAALVLFTWYLAQNKGSPSGNWRYPALLSVLFLAYSGFTVYQEGPTGFWIEHTRNFWGNQIWFDLLLFAGTALYFMVPKARKLGMNLPVWLLLSIATGSIGLLAMLARIFYLSQQGENLANGVSERDI